MSDKKKISVRCTVPPEVVKDFAASRGRVQHAVKSARRPVTYEEALNQVRSFLAEPLKP